MPRPGDEGRRLDYAGVGDQERPPDWIDGRWLLIGLTAPGNVMLAAAVGLALLLGASLAGVWRALPVLLAVTVLPNLFFAPCWCLGRQAAERREVVSR